MLYFAPTKLSENIRETPEGYLICVGVPIARTGEYEYGQGETPIDPGPDGKTIILREESEVFRKATIASFEGKPLTIRHPEDFVAPDNWKDLAKGHIQNVRRGEGDDKDSLIADILITDAVAISLVKSGMRGLSCGYEAEYIEDGKGRGRQTDIVGNHLALVEEGRAGPAYAINDEKGASSMSKKKQNLADRFLAIFSKAQDELKKAVDEDTSKDGEKEDKAKDDEGCSMDELVQMVKDLQDVVAGMKKSKDEEEEKSEDDDKDDDDKKGDKKDDDKSKDDDAEGASSIEARLKALEEAVTKIVEGQSEDDDEDGDEDGDGEDEGEKKDDEESKDDDNLVGDEKAKVEIIAPGLKATKDVKVKALKACYGTKDGKAVIDRLIGGEPDYKKKAQVEMVFSAAAELLKEERTSKLARTKTGDFSSNMGIQDGHMTPEKMNEINAKYFEKRA